MPPSPNLNRRTLLQAAAALCASPSALRHAAAAPLQTPRIDLLRPPDAIRAFLGDIEATPHPLARTGDLWSGAGAASGVDLHIAAKTTGSAITLHAPKVPIQRLHLRWRMPLSEDHLVLGDAWERSYGDLAWLPLQAERPLSWYALLHHGRGETTQGFGVATGAAAFAFWQADPAGISLWLDLRNGGNGVLLGDRTLSLATIVTRHNAPGQSPFQVAQDLCRAMAPELKLPTHRGRHSIQALFGSNDWYYAYGKNTAQGILRDAALMRELAPPGVHQPFTVVDDGYDDPVRFPDMAALAAGIRSQEVAPGVWVRPLLAPATTPATWLLPNARWGARKERAAEAAFDPTVPEARAAALAVVSQAKAWNFDLIKHDFSTYDLLGQWGFEMGPSPTLPGWHFHDRTRTNAEILTQLYRDLRGAAGENLIVLGCNTVGHLAAGLFDAQRTGDDVSGRLWERTRRMGVNTLAFRLPQHGAFFAADADCVPITSAIPWTLTEQWLRAVAGSGTVLLVSPEPGTIGPEQRRALRQAFAACAAQPSPSYPEDWLSTRTPTRWTKATSYAWTEPSGASPFSV